MIKHPTNRAERRQLALVKKHRSKEPVKELPDEFEDQALE